MDFPDSRDGGSSLFLGRVPVKTDWKTDPKSIGQPYLFGGKKEVWLPNRFWKVQFFNQFHQDGGQRCVWDPWKSSRVRMISQIGSNTYSHLHPYFWGYVEHSICGSFDKRFEESRLCVGKRTVKEFDFETQRCNALDMYIGRVCQLHFGTSFCTST